MIVTSERLFFASFFIICCFAVVPVQGFAESEDSAESDYQHCVCVPFWQCKEDYSGLVEDGIDVMDVRSSQSTSKDRSAQCVDFFDVCCRVQCGKSLSSSMSDTENEVPSNRRYDDDDDDDEYGNFFGFRILGESNEAKFAEFPWMLGILENDKYRCGGSLIHPHVAISAAHCVTGQGKFKIRAGEWNWEAATEPLSHQDQMAQRVIIHPHYHPGSLRNDIALIILEQPFRLTENVGLACLPFQGMSFDRKECIVTGWGKNSFKKGTYQSTLKKMDLPIVPRNRCLKSLQDARLGPMFNLHRSFICAGGEANRDACKGDGGSPLMCPVAGQPERYQQVGIVSWGLTCGVKNTPGVYVNVGLFTDWIDFIMSQHGFDTTVYKYRK